ncbi:MAG: EVE domain-containing protein [Spirochaetales bacterium]
MKIEPSITSIDDLAALPGQTVGWYGVRNYLARNYMRDQMRLGDLAFYYHSSCPEPGIAGVVRVSRESYADPTQFDPESEYFDPKATRAAPRWFQVEVTLVRKFPLVPLSVLRQTAGLEQMVVLQRGNRLSITPVSVKEWRILTGSLDIIPGVN